MKRRVKSNAKIMSLMKNQRFIMKDEWQENERTVKTR